MGQALDAGAVDLGQYPVQWGESFSGKVEVN